MIIVILISIIFYFAFLIYSNFNDVINALKVFKWWLIPLMLILAFSNYIIRGLKWKYYLDILKVKISLKNSYLIFFSGLSMSITPAKIGEVLKAYLLKKDAGTPIMTGVSIVFVERVTDLLGMMGLLCVGLIAFSYNIELIGIVFIILAIVIILINNKKIVMKLLKYLEQRKHTKKMAKGLQDSYITAYKLFRAKPLFIGFWLSFVSWSFECLCLYVALLGLGISINIFVVFFIFAFSSIIGVISMLPGGIGSTEGSMVFFLVFIGVLLSVATAAVILVRLATLWFAVILGLIALWIWQKKDSSSAKSII